MKKTIAEQLGVTKFPFDIRDGMGNLIYIENEDSSWSRREYDSECRQTYFEDSNQCWVKREYDEQGREIYYENSSGIIMDNRPKTAPQAEPMTIEIDGKKYKLTEI
jgi:hypothetical protein